jgi:hypothetical protein
MSELDIPDFPSQASIDRKVAAYHRKADEHRAGLHTDFTKGCKWCRVARDEARR